MIETTYWVKNGYNQNTHECPSYEAALHFALETQLAAIYGDEHAKTPVAVVVNGVYFTPSPLVCEFYYILVWDEGNYSRYANSEACEDNMEEVLKATFPDLASALEAIERYSNSDTRVCAIMNNQKQPIRHFWRGREIEFKNGDN
jgi:hypothetical protein